MTGFDTIHVCNDPERRCGTCAICIQDALRQRVETLESALRRCALVLSGASMSKNELIAALEAARATLETKP